MVGTDIGETRTLVGEGGTIVQPGDVDGMVEATRYWIGRRTKRRIRSWQRVGTQVIDAALEAYTPVNQT